MNETKLKVLAIDDNRNYLETFKTIMAGVLPGAAVFTAASGEKGLELALEEDPDAILLDISMPGINGYEVCRRVKQSHRLKNIPVMFVTASNTDKESRILALKAGGDGFLAKPFNTEELVSQVCAMAKIKAAGVAQALEVERLKNLEGERRRAAAAMRASEELFRGLFNHMSSGAAVYEAVDAGGDFVFRDFNPAAEKIDKIGRKEVVGRRVTEVFPGVRKFGLFEVFQRVWQTGRSEYLPLSPYDDGRICGGWRENWVFKLPDGGIAAVYNDITWRKQAETALIESEARYRMLFDQARDAILLLEPQPGGIPVIRDANETALRLHGYSRGELVGKPITFLDADTLESVLKDRAEMIKNNSGAIFEALHRRKDGSVFELEVSVRELEVGDKLMLIDISRDITERKKAGAALLNSEEKYRNLFAGSRDALMTLAPPSWLFTSGNPAALSLFGVKTEAEFTACTPGDLSPERQPDGRASMEKAGEMIATALREGSHFFEWTHRRLNGGDFPATVLLTSLELSGKRFLQATVRNVTGQKQSEAALRETLEMRSALNAMLQRSLANTPLREKLGSHLAGLFALPWLAIQPKGAVFLVTPAGNALALTVQQGLAPALLETCANVPLGRCLCGKAAETGRVVETVEIDVEHHFIYEGMAPHGHYCAPIIAGGKTLGVLNLYLNEGVRLTDNQRSYVKSVTDIMAENILHAQTEEKLTQSQKIESVGRLAGGIAHDFNNILTAIKCYSEFLHRSLDPQDPKQEDVREILTASERAVSLTRQLLAFSRRQIMTPKAADLNRCVGDVTNMLRRLIGEDVALTTKLASAPCPALLDIGQIGQVLVNLVLNARDAMPKGGEIELSTGLLAPSEELFLAHSDLPRGPLVYLRVRDTGYGMTAEVKSHLFEPFYTTKERGKGTGLGLATVFGIVKQSGGDIEAESESGKGALFSVYFPYCDSYCAEADAGGEARGAGEMKGLETVLLVEDEDSLLRLGKRVLESSGYTVLAAAGGAEALKILEARGKPVDLLLTDVVMPGMSGRELARELAQKGLVRRTLYMSGYTDDAIVKHGVLEPGLAFIYKPFTIDAMLAKVRLVLDAPAGWV